MAQAHVTELSDTVPMPCNKLTLNQQDCQTLLTIAKQSIANGLEHNAPLPIQLEDYSQDLQKTAASFVTLQKEGQLRGCIGTLEAQTSLVEDVAQHAFAAAFQDPRFAPVSHAELNQLALHISVLTPTEPLLVESEADLLAKLRPGIDGLVLREDWQRATFLPSVWQQLPTAKEFLQHLKQKAGLPANYWSDTLQFEHYQVIDIE